LKPKRKTKAPDVSDHALVRYFERVLGFDIKEIEKDILSPDFMSVYSFSQPTKARIPFCKDFRAVVHDKVIVTIIGRRDKRHAKKPGQK